MRLRRARAIALPSNAEAEAMSHFLDRLTFFTRRREPFAEGHGELRDEDRKWEEGYRRAGSTTRSCARPTA